MYWYRCVYVGVTGVLVQVCICRDDRYVLGSGVYM